MKDIFSKEGLGMETAQAENSPSGLDQKREDGQQESIAGEVKAFLKQEDGVGVIEVVLILVVLIGLVIVFKGQINKLLEDIFKEINSQSKEVY